MDIAEWLRGLGLGQYAPAFIENSVGWDVLPKDDRDRACYVTDEKTIRLRRTPPLPPSDNATVQKSVVTVRSDGSVMAERTAEYRGLAAWNKRDDYVDTPTGERHGSPRHA